MIPLVRLFRFLEGSVGALILSMILLLLSTGLGLVQPQLIEYAIDGGIKTGKVSVVIWSAVGIIVTALLAGGINLASGYTLIKSAQKMGYEMRNALYRKVMSFSFENLDHWHTGELMVRLNSDVNSVRMFVRMGMFMIVRSILMILGSIIAMYLTDPGLAGIMAIFMPLTLAMFFAIATYIRPLFMKARIALDELNNTLQENLAGAKVVRAFARQKEELAKFGIRNTNLFKINLNVGYKLALFFPLFFLIAQLATVIVLWAGGTTLIENAASGIAGNLTLGKLIAFNNFATMAMFPQYWITLSIIRIHNDHSPGVSRLERERSAKIPRYLDQSCSKIPFENPRKLT
jgi:ABC-type multidrug transport system fused ATPase/permease subunit